MPLTAELADPHSVITEWMTGRFPHVDALQPVWTAALRGARTLRPHHDGEIDWPGIGTAFGYRLGYAFASYPPYHALRAIPVLSQNDRARHHLAALFQAHRNLPRDYCADLRPLPDGRVLQLPPSPWANCYPCNPSAVDPFIQFFTRLADAVDTYPLHTCCSPQLERSLAKAWYALGLLEGVYRRGFDQAAATWLPKAARDMSSDYLISLAPAYVINDLAQLADALTSKGLRQFPTGAAVVSPEMVDRWADADLLVGDLLIDCKTTVKPRELHAEWVYQLLGYTLLDSADCYGTRQVGIYLARQARLVTWTLAEFLTTLSGHPATPLDQLRSEFADIVAVTLTGEDPTGWRPRWITNIQPVASRSAAPVPAANPEPDCTRRRFADRLWDAVRNRRRMRRKPPSLKQLWDEAPDAVEALLTLDPVRFERFMTLVDADLNGGAGEATDRFCGALMSALGRARWDWYREWPATLVLARTIVERIGGEALAVDAVRLADVYAADPTALQPDNPEAAAYTRVVLIGLLAVTAALKTTLPQQRTRGILPPDRLPPS